MKCSNKKTWLCFGFLLFSLLFVPNAEAAALRQGDRGEQVQWIQERLEDLGYEVGEADGVFGEETRQAIVQFQLSRGLDADGVVGAGTFYALQQRQAAAEVNRGFGRRGAQIVQMAQQYMGTPYAWGGSSPGGFDCSGFIYYIYGQFGISLPRMSDGQFEVGRAVSGDNLLPGDLIFFTTYEPGASHVGIYLGGGRFIHASSAAGEVTITPLGKSYYQERYLGARRVW
ncbi:NlpC/P60 family protein [uncultured Anaeromusa sp.]|uniref:C40 family peptidase n=1 Tax=uncultured Anaeromusa sp. TaxID=673273 RepID=UPI0029C6DABF|nr:NlpC/P60 family protein [uncultured Anaeromusa sp.]